MKRKVAAGAVAIGVLISALAAWRFQAMISAQQPALSELPAGARAPSGLTLLGLTIHRSSLDEVKAATAKLKCVDRSISKQIKDGIAAAIEQRQKEGEWALRYRIYGWINPHGRNPQVRWDCAVTDGAAIGIPRALEEGRVLFVHDALGLPLRHTSVQRTWHTDDATRADVGAAIDRLSVRFGQPTPNAHVAELQRGPIAEVTPYSWEWRWTDLRVELNLVRYPGGRYVVAETIEVPWPVRSDWSDAK